MITASEILKQRYANDAEYQAVLAEEKALYCSRCGQKLTSVRTGEYPCAKCGIATLHDANPTK